MYIKFVDMTEERERVLWDVRKIYHHNIPTTQLPNSQF